MRSNGTEEAFTLPASALPALADLLDRLSSADNVTVLADDAEITPEDAAGILGISRPLVRRRMDVGVLPFRRVGAHRRIRLADVLAAALAAGTETILTMNLRDFPASALALHGRVAVHPDDSCAACMMPIRNCRALQRRQRTQTPVEARRHLRTILTCWSARTCYN